MTVVTAPTQEQKAAIVALIDHSPNHLEHLLEWLHGISGNAVERWKADGNDSEFYRGSAKTFDDVISMVRGLMSQRKRL